MQWEAWHVKHEPCMLVSHDSPGRLVSQDHGSIDNKVAYTPLQHHKTEGKCRLPAEILADRKLASRHASFTRSCHHQASCVNFEAFEICCDSPAVGATGYDSPFCSSARPIRICQQPAFALERGHLLLDRAEAYLRIGYRQCHVVRQLDSANCPGCLQELARC